MGGSAENNPFNSQPTGSSNAPAGLQDFLDYLNGTETTPGLADRFGQVGNSLLDAGTSLGDDPLTAMQRAQGLEAMRGALSRRGVTGSVAMNQLARTNMGFDQQALGRKQSFLEQGSNFLTDVGQFKLAEPTLDVAMQNARNAGSGGGGGKK